jgi:hypothetical protein
MKSRNKKLAYKSAKETYMIYGSAEGHVKMKHFDELINETVRVECIWCDGFVGLMKLETKENSLIYRIIGVCKTCTNTYESSVKKLKPKMMDNNNDDLR